MSTLTVRLGETALKRALVLGVIGAIFMSISFMAVSALTAESLNSGSVKLGNATFAVDGDTTVTATGIVINEATVGANASAEALISPYGALNDAITEGDYSYSFDVFESGDDTWLSSQTYTIRVWETTGGTTSSLGTFSTLQASPVVGTVEGVTVTINLGSVIPDEFDIIVEKD